MPDTPDSPDTPSADDRKDHAGGFTINLASGVSPGSRPRRNKKSAAPKAVVQKTINLSTPKAESDATSPKASASGQKPNRGKKGTRGNSRGGPKGKPTNKRPSSGTSLADLLDPEVLAKLKGG